MKICLLEDATADDVRGRGGPEEEEASGGEDVAGAGGHSGLKLGIVRLGRAGGKVGNPLIGHIPLRPRIK